MVLCVVVGCSKRSGRDRDVSFYRIPKVIKSRGEEREQLSEKRRSGFLAAIMRADLTEKILVNDRICSRHFLSGKPADLLDVNNPDWLPSLYLGNSKQVSETRAKAAEDRWERAKVREIQKNQEVEKACTNDVSVEEGPVEASTQTELTLGKIEDMNDSIRSGMEEVKSLKSEISKMQKFNETLFVENDDRVQFYTGLPTYKVLKTVFHFCAPSDKCTKLTQFQEFLLTLIKLRLNSPLKDLAY